MGTDLKTIALTIAASDSSSGAGIQADLRVFAELGVFGLCAVTCVTAQNSGGVLKIFKVAPRTIMAQIDAATTDFKVGACKIGMLYLPQTIGIVAERIARREIPNVVLDPVMNAKGGEILLAPQAVKRLKRWLLPKVRLVTPNAPEAQALTKIEVTDPASALEAAKALVGMGAGAALVKGGHMADEPVDVLYDGENVFKFAGKRQAKNMHGTGCVLSSAIAARLAMGDELPAAVEFAKGYIEKAIANSVRLGKGGLDYFVGTGP